MTDEDIHRRAWRAYKMIDHNLKSGSYSALGYDWRSAPFSGYVEPLFDRMITREEWVKLDQFGSRRSDDPRSFKLKKTYFSSITRHEVGGFTTDPGGAILSNVMEAIDFSTKGLWLVENGMARFEIEEDALIAKSVVNSMADSLDE